MIPCASTASTSVASSEINSSIPFSSESRMREIEKAQAQANCYVVCPMLRQMLQLADPDCWDTQLVPSCSEASRTILRALPCWVPNASTTSSCQPVFALGHLKRMNWKQEGIPIEQPGKQCGYSLKPPVAETATCSSYATFLPEIQ